jgi:hypothetical protein
LIKKIKETLWFYRESLDACRQYRNEFSSLLVFREELEQLTQKLPTQSDETAQLRERLRQLNLEAQQLIEADPKRYEREVRKELQADLQKMERYLEFLPGLTGEEALHLWVIVDTAEGVLAELERRAGAETCQKDRQWHEALVGILRARLLSLPAGSEVAKTMPSSWAAAPRLTLKEILQAVRCWTPEEREQLRRALVQQEPLYKRTEAGEAAIAEKPEKYDEVAGDQRSG